MKKTNESLIRNRLVEHGKQLFNAPKQLIRFTKNDTADVLLNDLDYHSHAFVLACVMDRQIKAEKAWLIPYYFQQKLNGDFSISRLASLSIDDVKRLMTQPEPLHRFVDKMSGFFHATVHRIINHYDNDASRIWHGKPSSADVVYRFLEFDGVGPKIASMAANILAREFKVPFGDYYSIDISADVHVRRVFSKLGLTSPNATIEQLIFRARSLHPEFPGLMDFPSWEIGRSWCRPSRPTCGTCYMNDLCPTSLKAELNVQHRSETWKWVIGNVDTNREYIEIRYGDINEVKPQDFITVARIGPPHDKTFTIEFLIDPTSSEYSEVIESTQKELDFYLVEKEEPDPWAYAKYHCTTAANLYSPVHWGLFEKKK